MAMTERNDEPEAPNLTMKTRLKAWWEGYDLSGLKRRKDEDDGPQIQAVDTTRDKPQPGVNRWGKPLWTANRIEVTEKLWGVGFSTPGGSDHIPYLVKPLGLNPAMSVLDLSAGLGGASRTMAGKYGCWVTGLEASPLLAKEGMERSIKAGLQKQAPIDTYDPESFTYNRRVDAIIYKEGLFTVHDKEQMFDGMEMHLKPRGQIVMTDYVLAPDANLARLRVWAEHEPQEPVLWPPEAYANAFAQRNLDLRISEDITDTHRALIVTAIQALVAYLEKHAMDAETKKNVMDEVELWVRRVSALKTGLRCYRFYALKPPDAA